MTVSMFRQASRPMSDFSFTVSGDAGQPRTRSRSRGARILRKPTLILGEVGSGPDSDLEESQAR